MARQKKSKYYVRPDGLHETIRTINGKRVAFRGKTDADVDRKMIEYSERQKKGRTFKAVADIWEADIRAKVSLSTWSQCYSAPYNRAVDAFGDRRVKDVTARQVEAYIKEFARGGRSKQLVTVQLQVIRNIFAISLLDSEIQANPADAVSLPANLPKTRRELPPDDQIERIKAANPEGMGLFALLVLYTGMRRGEALAITGEDFSDDEIRICKSVSFNNTNQPTIKLPKTKKGVRTVPLLSPLKAALPKKLPSGYLFSDDGENPITAKAFVKRWEKWARENSITITPHQLRHGYATMLFEAGLAPKDMQDLLGHAQLSTSMDIYTHISTSRKKEAKTKLEAFLSSTETQK